MAQSGFTPLLIYGSTTPGNTPTAGNLTTSSDGVELAINAADGKLFYKDNLGVVQTLVDKNATPAGGSTTQVQFNNAGFLAGSSSLTWDGTTLTSTGFAGPLNGTVGAGTPASGAFTTLSASSTTTLSSLTASTALALNSSKEIVSVTNTGTGNNVLATSPTLTTPTVSGALTYGGVALSASVTGTGNMVLSAGPTFTGTTTLATVSPETLNASSVGYTGMPQNAQSAAYTTVAADAGKTIVHPASDNNARTFTIDSNANVAYPVGTTITFINMINTVTIAITTDTMYLAGPGTTGSRTLAAYGIATAIKVSSTSWIISGNGLT